MLGVSALAVRILFCLFTAVQLLVYTQRSSRAVEGVRWGWRWRWLTERQKFRGIFLFPPNQQQLPFTSPILWHTSFIQQYNNAVVLQLVLVAIVNNNNNNNIRVEWKHEIEGTNCGPGTALAALGTRHSGRVVKVTSLCARIIQSLIKSQDANAFATMFIDSVRGSSGFKEYSIRLLTRGGGGDKRS